VLDLNGLIENPVSKIWRENGTISWREAISRGESRPNPPLQIGTNVLDEIKPSVVVDSHCYLAVS